MPTAHRAPTPDVKHVPLVPNPRQPRVITCSCGWVSQEHPSLVRINMLLWGEHIHDVTLLATGLPAPVPRPDRTPVELFAAVA